MSNATPASAAEGFWRDNAGLVQLLGLCPLLAVTDTVVSAACIGVVITVVLAASNAAVSLLRAIIPNEIRILAFTLIITAIVTAVQLSLNAYAYRVHVMLGIYVPLLATNCLVLARAERFAYRQPVPRAVLDGVIRGIGLASVLLALGALREIFGKGTLFAGVEKVLGPAAATHVIHVMPQKYNLLLVSLPPGAFIGLALLIALKNRLGGGSIAPVTR
jgi:Na+-translocating ferredoxin:NAD+ oxidoreductase subunit E